MCQYMRFCHLSHVPRLRLACAFLKFHQKFNVLTHPYMQINDTYVWLFRDDATSAKGPGCDEGTNLRLRDFALVPLI